MSILDIFFGNKEKTDSRTIGSIECDRSNLVSLVTNLASSFGMSNVGMLSHSSKGIGIKRINNDTFEITLYKYNPPLKIVWSNTAPLSQLAHIIEMLSQDNVSIAAINQFSKQNGSFVQLGVFVN